MRVLYYRSLGCSLAGKWGDQLGRVEAFWRLMVVTAAGGFLTACMPEYWTYLLARFVAGCGGGGWGIVTWVMASEFWGEGYRNCLGCLCHIPYCIGLALFPAIIWPFASLEVEFSLFPSSQPSPSPSCEGRESADLALLRPDSRLSLDPLLPLGPTRACHPRKPSVLHHTTTTTTTTCVVPCRFIPYRGSSRWLLSSLRVDEAVSILEYGAEQSGRPLPSGWVLQSVVKETPKHTEKDAVAVAGSVGCCDLFHHGSFGMYISIMCAMWFATSFGYYGLIFQAFAFIYESAYICVFGYCVLWPHATNQD